MQCLWVGAPDSSTVEVAASPPAVCLGPELASQLRQAPHPGAVGTEVGLDVGRRRTDGGQVDAEQLRAPLQWRLLSRPTARTASSSLSFSLPGSRLGLSEDG
jgi:hypothetical protein